MKIIIILKTPPLYKNKQDYGDGTNDKARESDDSPSDTDGCARNFDDENKNEEDEDYIDPPSKKNDTIISNSEEDVRNRLLAKIFTQSNQSCSQKTNGVN